MKRFRIWIRNFSLVQQFVSVILLTLFVIFFFFFTSLKNNINSFTDSQMYSYLHRSQSEYIIRMNSEGSYEDPNAHHFVYSTRSGEYLSHTDGFEKVLEKIDPLQEGDGTLTLQDDYYVYAVFSYGDYRLISFINEEYRMEFQRALSDGTVNTVFIVMACLFLFVMIWILTLIVPLNKIRDYITRLELGEHPKLDIGRRDEIGSVAIALTNMDKELSAQQKMRDEMIQNISHDLKTPIAAIKSYSESIKDGIYPYETLEKSVDVILEHAERLEKKTYSLITFNKFGYLRDCDESISQNMETIINKAIISCEVMRNEVQILTDVDKDIYFHGEEDPWRVVVENLLDNCLRYAKSVVRITLKKDLLEVYDDGPLMNKDMMKKMFSPYEKGNKGKFGLGLSIVKRVVETYGYNVVGENTDDGVVFRIYRIASDEKEKE